MNVATRFDADLLRRYDRPTPRYTSYPTAPQFNSTFGAPQLRDYARRSNEQAVPRPLSLYVHIPYCRAPCFYCGCNRLITRDPHKGTLYLERLQREIELAAPLFERQREVVQVHLGGGTPNFLRPRELGALFTSLHNHFNLSTAAGRDFSIELDPRFIEHDDLGHLAQIGFNRASFGVQDFAPEVQQAINRVQSVEQTLAAIAACRESRFRSVNVDLIYGLPRQTPAGFANTLDTLIAVRPDRFAIYGYAHLPSLFKAQRQIDSQALPDGQAKLRLLQLAIERLTAAGYRYIGMDHFALPDDELAIAQEESTLQRNFQGYTTHGHCDLIGLGVSAISQIGDLYCQNSSDLNHYQNTLAGAQLATSRGLVCNADDRLRRAVIQQLICNFSLDFAEIERTFNIDFQGYFGALWPQLQGMAKDGLIELDRERINVLPAGRLLVRSVCMVFDAYLEQQNRQRFSRVI